MMKEVISMRTYKSIRQILKKYDIYNYNKRMLSGCFPHIDFEYLCNPCNTELIKQNIKKRKGIGDIDGVINLYGSWLNSPPSEKDVIKTNLLQKALKIPNMSHSDVLHLDENPTTVKEIGKPREVSFKVLPFEEISDKLNLCRTDNISNFTGPRSYFLLDHLALLEQALIKYAIAKLEKFNFNLISVPDILPRGIIEMCGMETQGERNQVYSLEKSKWDNLCLSGTAEMGIAYYFHNDEIDQNELPLKIAAVSRCFRAETSKISEEKGIYRVHQFTKVEMFGIANPGQSDSLLNEFVQIQEDIFSSLGLCLRILDMPPFELGAQAARKFDVESWLPGKRKWGEVSSASNCTDYQSRRLGITCGKSYPHTVNGTACAIPRLIIALLETYQQKDGSIELPEVLEPFLGFRTISKSSVPELNTFKKKLRYKQSF